jgi:hypothetical protein
MAWLKSPEVPFHASMQRVRLALSGADASAPLDSLASTNVDCHC